MTDREKWKEFLRLKYPTVDELTEEFDDAEISYFDCKDQYLAYNELYSEYMNE